MTGFQESKLSPKKEKVLLALLSCGSIGESAKQSGMSERSIYRLLRDPQFQGHYQAAKQDIMKGTLARLQHASQAATKTLCQVMEDIEAPAHSRVAAARTVLEMALRATEMETIGDRIERLESRLCHLQGAN